MKIRLDGMTWPEVEEALRKPNAVIVPTGSTEQHGLHLPLNVDACCATHMAEQAARKVNDEHQIRVIVAPTISYGETTTFSLAGFTGTIGVSVDTMIRVIEDIARNFITQGFKNIIFVNGHAENIIPISTALKKLSIDYPDAGLYALNWWALGFEVVPEVCESKIRLHADEVETSVSLVIQPENVYLDKAVAEYPVYSLSEKWVFPDFYGANRVFYHSRKKFPIRAKGNPGVMGDATVASKEKGEKIIKAVVDNLAEIIVEVVQSEQ